MSYFFQKSLLNQKFESCIQLNTNIIKIWLLLIWDSLLVLPYSSIKLTPMHFDEDIFIQHLPLVQISYGSRNSKENMPINSNACCLVSEFKPMTIAIKASVLEHWSNNISTRSARGRETNSKEKSIKQTQMPLKIFRRQTKYTLLMIRTMHHAAVLVLSSGRLINHWLE